MRSQVTDLVESRLRLVAARELSNLFKLTHATMTCNFSHPQLRPFACSFGPSSLHPPIAPQHHRSLHVPSSSSSPTALAAAALEPRQAA